MIIGALYFYGFVFLWIWGGCAFVFNRNVRNYNQTSWSHFTCKMKRNERPLKYNSAFLGCLHFQPEKGALKIFLQNTILYYSYWVSLVLSAPKVFKALGIVNSVKRKCRYNLLLKVDFNSCNLQHKWFVDISDDHSVSSSQIPVQAVWPTQRVWQLHGGGLHLASPRKTSEGNRNCYILSWFCYYKFWDDLKFYFSMINFNKPII